MTKYFIAVVFLMCMCCQINAENRPGIIRLDTSAEQQNRVADFEIYTAEVTDNWQAVVADSIHWKSLGQSGIAMPAYTRMWLKITLYNPYEMDMPLELNFSSIEISRIVLLDTQDGLILQQWETGASIPVSRHPSKRASLNIPLVLLEKQSHTYYLFLENGWTHVDTEVSFRNFMYSDGKSILLKHWQFIGFTVGLAAMLSGLALLLCALFFRPILLWYTVYVVGGTLYLAASFGIGAEWIWGEFPYFEEMSAEFFGALTLSGLVLMSRLVYRTAIEYPLLDKYLLVVVGMGTLFLIAASMRCLLPSTLVYGISVTCVVFALPGMVAILAIGFLRWFRHKEREQRWFFIMFLYSILFGIIMLLTAGGILPVSTLVSSILPSYSVIIEGFFATLFISSYLYRQIQQEQQEKLRIELQRKEELQEISLGLHDEVGSMLSNTILRTDLMMQQYSGKDNQEQLESISHQLRTVYDSLRDLAWVWNPARETWPQVLERLRIFTEETLENTEIRQHFQVISVPDGMPLSPSACRDIYFLAKEAVVNASKHSQAKDIWIVIEHSTKSFRLEIKDNGLGFDSSNEQAGNGFANMRHRTARIGGVLSFESQPGQYTRVLLELPGSH